MLASKSQIYSLNNSRKQSTLYAFYISIINGVIWRRRKQKQSNQTRIKLKTITFLKKQASNTTV